MAVSDEDLIAIAGHLEMTVDAARARYVDERRGVLKNGLGTRCVFLLEGPDSTDSKPQCSIYPVRPERCRTWPFWPELREDPGALRAALRLCPGLDCGSE